MGELISLACVLGQEKEFATYFKKVFGKPPPNPNEMVEIKGGFAMWSGQCQYMLLLSGENIQADTEVADKLKGTAYATLQSDGAYQFCGPHQRTPYCRHSFKVKRD